MNRQAVVNGMDQAYILDQPAQKILSEDNNQQLNNYPVLNPKTEQVKAHTP